MLFWLMFGREFSDVLTSVDYITYLFYPRLGPARTGDTPNPPPDGTPYDYMFCIYCGWDGFGTPPSPAAPAIFWKELSRLYL